MAFDRDRDDAAAAVLSSVGLVGTVQEVDKRFVLACQPLVGQTDLDNLVASEECRRLAFQDMLDLVVPYRMAVVGVKEADVVVVVVVAAGVVVGVEVADVTVAVVVVAGVKVADVVAAEVYLHCTA